MDQAIVSFVEKRVIELKEKEESDFKILEYQRALSETLMILKGSIDLIHSDKLMVLDWKEEYGACILLKPRTFDPMNGIIYVVGLDGWTFTMISGEHTAVAGDDPAFLHAGMVSLDSVNDFVVGVNEELSEVAGKKGDERHSSNSDGGHQKTPGFLYMKCVEVLNSFKTDEELQINPQNSGFTDVSMHTGCNKRETTEPLTFSLIKTVLKLGMVPPVQNAVGYFVRFCTEYHLQLAWEAAHKSPTSDYADQAMIHLSDASKYGVILADSLLWPDTKTFSEKFVEIRKILESGLEKEATINSGLYQTFIPNLKEIELMPSPEIILGNIPGSDKNEEQDEKAILNKSKTNLNWIPYYELKTLNDCLNLLNDDRISSSEPYFFSIVLVQVEKFLFNLAGAYLAEDLSSHVECGSEALISVVEILSKKIRAFSSKQNSFLKVELISHIALLKWLKFCVLFELGIQKYKTLSNYAPALDFHDLEHLVLRNKSAWDCVDIICNYLERRRQVSKIIVFSGRPEEVNGTFDFADKFVCDDDNHAYYERLLSQEKSDAEFRIDTRWRAIEKKKRECNSIRQEISLLQEELIAAESKRDSHDKSVWCSYNSRYIRNLTWKKYDDQCDLISGQISKAWAKHAKIKIAPSYLKQPLPQSDIHGKRALFFCYMPQLLIDIWSESYEAEWAIFHTQTAKYELSQWMNYHEFYDGSCDFRERKNSIHTPLVLYCPSCPKKFGSGDVETISSRDDGVWYPKEFKPSMIWKYANPFIISRDQAVKYFTEPISNEKLQWAVAQAGIYTPPDRGNLAISKLYEKPDYFTREQYITFGNIRAFPLLQIMNVLDSITRMTLPLMFSETHELIQLVFYHLGELAYSDELGVIKSWKDVLYDKQVILGFRSELENFMDRLKDAPKNHKEFLIGIEIISFLSQFASDSFVSLADACSSIATDWANNMEKEIINSRNSTNFEMQQGTLAKQHIFFLYAVLAYEMVPFLTPDQVEKVLSLVVRINATLPLDEITYSIDNNVKNLKLCAEKLICRVNFMLVRVFHSWDFDDFQLTEAARCIFPSRVESHMKWKKLDGNYCYYTKNNDGYYISLNVLNGTTLLNGEPPGRLPFDVLNHPLYLEVFGKNQNFTTELEYDGTKKTINPSKGRYYSFKSIQNHLVVIEEDRSNDMMMFKLRLLDSANIDKWGQQLPIGLKKLYSHWQSDDRDLVVIRPIHFMSREVYYIYVGGKLFLIPQEHRNLSLIELADHIGQFDRMIYLNEPLCDLILNMWSKFDLKKFIHVFITGERSIKVVFVRYRLSFELAQGANCFISLDHAQYKVRKCQVMKEIWNGFHNYLILEKDSRSRKILVPNHLVKQINNDVTLERDSDQVFDLITENIYSYNSFSPHLRFHHIKATNICGRIQLASVFAATGKSVPEKWTGMTGFEMAIRILRGCWVNQPLDPYEFNMLNSMLKLRNLPSGLILVAHSLFENSKRVKFLFPEEKNTPSNAILDKNQFSCALNHYVLPMYPQDPPKNIRSELTEEECQSLLEIVYLPKRFERHSKNEVKKNYVPIDIFAKERKILYLTSDNQHLNSEASESNCAEQEEHDNIAKNDSPLPFDLPEKLISTEIGNHMISQLSQSYCTHRSIRKPILSDSVNDALKKSQKLFKIIEYERKKLENQIKTETDICSKSEAWDYHRFIISRASNKLPLLNSEDLAKSTFNPEMLLSYNPMLTNEELEYFRNMILDWMQLCVLEDRLERIIQLLQNRKVEESIREIQTYRNYNVKCHPEWLAFEVDQGIQIRPEQMDIINDILKNPGSVTQLNMGLGKTRVILPCLFLQLSRPKSGQVVSIYLLSALLNEGFSYFHQVLTAGIFNKKLFLMPFNRDVKVTEKNARTLLATIKHCQKAGGGLVLAPEYRLSLYLKTYEAKPNSISQTLEQIDCLPFVNIYDEADEIMNPIRQLIYAEGNPELLHAGQRRWQAMFCLFFNLRHSMDVKNYLVGKEISSQIEALDQEYNMFQLLPCNALENILSELTIVLARSLFSKSMVSSKDTILHFSLDWMNRLTDKDLIERIVTFITDKAVSTIVQESEFERADHYHDILALRGILAHGIMSHCLMLRYNVNYGVVDGHKTPMAIPFRAANLPVLRSEFAQPDCAIGLTIISYYSRGLDEKQLHSAFLALLQSGPSFRKSVYQQIYYFYVLSNGAKPEVDSVEKIDLANLMQRNLLYSMYKKSMLLINFWLGSVVFPTQTMIFPGKLAANSWHLTHTNKSEFQCGFSGTVDSCIFLPNPLYLQKAANISLAATDGKMIDHLMKNASYESIPNDLVENDIVDQLINLAIARGADAFIDAGALLCGYSNEDVAVKFLGALAKSNFKGVVFFSTDNKTWTIIDRRGRFCALETSPIHESEAFVIYDQSRCRGADMKLKTNAIAILTIGPKIRKEDLMQAAGRLRKLDYGQRMIVTTTSEVELMLRDSIDMKKEDSIMMNNVLLYTFLNSIKWIGESLGHYSSQGIQFLLEPRQKELTSLTDMYEGEKISGSLQKLMSHKLHNVPCSRRQESSHITKTIIKSIDRFGMDVFQSSYSCIDQVERELKHEKQIEKEKELQLTEIPPAPEKDWDYKVLFDHPLPEPSEIGQSIQILEFLKSHISETCVQHINWESNSIYLTKNFAFPLLEHKKLDDYMRPVRHGLYFPSNQKILLLSTREADRITEVYRCRKNEKRHPQEPILLDLNCVKGGLEIKPGSVYARLISNFEEFTDTIYAMLELFDGKTDLRNISQKELSDKLIQNQYAIDGARFFYDRRGFRNLFEGSSLERTLDQISFKLFNQRKSC